MIEIDVDVGRTGSAMRLSLSRVQCIAAVVSRALHVRRTVSVSLAFVGEATMQRVNAAYRGKHQATDVLSFTFGKPDMFGEILLCSAVARRQARAAKRSMRDELTELLVHGLLHLFGHDHEKPKDAAKMLSLQDRLMQRIL